MEDVPLRTMATQVLGEMFGDGKAGSDLARKYPTTWNMWLTRKNDKVVGVRLALVEAAKGLIANLPELREQVEGEPFLPFFSSYILWQCDAVWRQRLICGYRGVADKDV